MLAMTVLCPGFCALFTQLSDSRSITIKAQDHRRWIREYGAYFYMDDNFRILFFSISQYVLFISVIINLLRYLHFQRALSAPITCCTRV